jgi:hypothetical protein
VAIVANVASETDNMSELRFGEPPSACEEVVLRNRGGLFRFEIHPSGTLKQTDALHPLLKRPIP